MKLYYYLEFRILLPKWHLLITRIHNETTSISQSISSGWSLAFDILGTAVLLLCHRSITRLNWREVELRSVWCQFLTFVGRFSMTHLALGYMLSLMLLTHLLKYSLALIGCILFKSACIPKSVKRMICWGTSRGYAGNHHDSDLVFLLFRRSWVLHHEGISKNHCQFTGTEWDVCTFIAWVLSHIKASNAFLQSKKALVDLSTFQSSLSVVALAIRCPLTSS